MPAQPVADAQGSLEIDPRTGAPGAHRRAVKRRRHGRGGEPLWTMLANRETRAIHGDALARREIRVAALDPKFTARVRRRDSRNPSDVVDQAGEHSTS